MAAAVLDQLLLTQLMKVWAGPLLELLKRSVVRHDPAGIIREKGPLLRPLDTLMLMQRPERRKSCIACRSIYGLWD